MGIATAFYKLFKLFALKRSTWSAAFAGYANLIFISWALVMALPAMAADGAAGPVFSF